MTNYIKLSRLELKHVNWPTRKDTVKFTLLVILISLLIAAFLGFLDFLFVYLLSKLVL
ncbi:MAG: preprotein translocase subunit SecE [Patescibacteria group bacterium]